MAVFKSTALAKTRLMNGDLQNHGPFGIGIRIGQIISPVGPARNTVELFIDVEDALGERLATLDMEVVLNSYDSFHIKNIANAFQVKIFDPYTDAAANQDATYAAHSHTEE